SVSPSVSTPVVIADRFELDRAIGSGSMGVVYHARDRLTGEAAAVKMMSSDATIARFGREVLLLSELSHPAIVRYLGHGGTPEGEPFLAMEWLEGETLAERLDGAEPLTLGESLAVARRVAGALAMAHGRGVVHRDIKPSNLFLPGGDVAATKVLDFGIA